MIMNQNACKFDNQEYPLEILEAATQVLETCQNRAIEVKATLFSMLKFHVISSHHNDLKKFYAKRNVFFEALNLDVVRDIACLTSMLGKSSSSNIARISNSFINMGDTEIQYIAKSPWLKNISSMCSGKGLPKETDVKTFLNRTDFVTSIHQFAIPAETEKMKNLKKMGTFTVQDELNSNSWTESQINLRSIIFFIFISIIDDERFMFTNPEPTQVLYRPLPTVDNIDPEALNGQRQNAVCARFQKLYPVFAISDLLPHLKVVAGTIAGSTVGSITIGLACTISVAALSAFSLAFTNAVNVTEEIDIPFAVKLTSSLGGLGGALAGSIYGGIVGYYKVSSKLDYKNDVTQEKHHLLPHDTLPVKNGVIYGPPRIARKSLPS